MELHERWLAELHSERMKHKLALAEGRITSEEYMDNFNKEIDLSTLSIQEVYELRYQASQKGDTTLLSKIWIFLNCRSGAFDETETLESLLGKRRQMKDDLASGKISDVEYKKFIDKLHLVNKSPIRKNININHYYGATGRERRFIEAGKLIQGDERVLVLVPHGTPEELNVNSIKFWDLQKVLLNATYQEDPDSADLKDPQYLLMDPTFEELRDPDSLIQQEMKKADIILRLNSYDQWVITKTPHQELDNSYLWVLKIPEIKLDELFVNNPKEVWVYIDHRLGHTNQSENLYHALAEHLSKIKPDVKLYLMSGHPTAEWLLGKEIVLMAGRFDFLVKKASQTPHTHKVISIKEVTGIDPINFTLTSQCRTGVSLKPATDINIEDIYLKPLMPYEAPGQGYALSAQIQESHDQLTQDELGKMSLARFGFLLVDPDTGMTVSKEKQDKFANECNSSKQPKESK